MTARDLKKKYFEFFQSKRHVLIPSAALVPENDPTALFISAGMQPLVPYLLGETHPAGKRLVNVQKCLRTDDIDEVGDNCHHTFFEMLGNWSLGDYGKEEAISWSFEFLTSAKWLNLPIEKLAISVFSGDSDAPFDKDSFDTWLKLGIKSERIAKLPKKNNWWGPIGETGPCGPDTEMFFWIGKEKAPEMFDPENPSWVEFWNDVFIEFNKTADGKYEPLKQKNVDTGMGVERVTAVLNGSDDDYQTDLFAPIIKTIEVLSGRKYDEQKRDFRVIVDHLRAAVFLMVEKVEPGNLGQGYILKRLIRRAARKGKLLKINYLFTAKVAEEIIEKYTDDYLELKENKQDILLSLTREEEKFQKPLNWVEQYKTDLLATMENKAIKRIKDVAILTALGEASGAYVYENYQSYGVPPDLSREVAEELSFKFDQKGYDEAFKKHQELSRTASVGMFKGGLGETGEMATKYHTATHLLNESLRRVLGDHVYQKGSNITAERLRFDFPHPEKLTESQIKEAEDLVNEKIDENLPVKMEIMTLEEAKKSGAQAVFAGKYEDKVKVYTIGPSTLPIKNQDRSGRPFSVEICGGPHTPFTGELGKFKIIKEESAGSGIRRIYATLEHTT